MEIEIGEISIRPDRRYFLVVRSEKPTKEILENIGRSFNSFGFPGNVPVLFLNKETDIKFYNIFKGDVFTIPSLDMQSKSLLFREFPENFIDVELKSNKIMVTLPDEERIEDDVFPVSERD